MEVTVGLNRCFSFDDRLDFLENKSKPEEFVDVLIENLEISEPLGYDRVAFHRSPAIAHNDFYDQFSEREAESVRSLRSHGLPLPICLLIFRMSKPIQTTKRHTMNHQRLQARREALAGKVVIGIDSAKDKHQAAVVDAQGNQRGSSFSFPVSATGYGETLWRYMAKLVRSCNLRSTFSQRTPPA